MDRTLRAVLPEKKWDKYEVATLFLGVFTTLFVAMVVGMAIGKALPDVTKEDREFYTMVLGNVALQVGAFVWVNVFLRRHKMTWAEAFGFRNGRWFSNSFVAFVAFLFFLPVAWGLQQLSALALTRVNVEAPPQQVVLVLQGELPMWRRIYYGFAAVIFGLSHFNKISFIPLALFGALLAWLYLRTGNLLVPVATHCLFNLTNFFFIWFQTQILEWWKRFQLF